MAEEVKVEERKDNIHRIREARFRVGKSWRLSLFLHPETDQMQGLARNASALQEYKSFTSQKSWWAKNSFSF
jgi:hypothetical protein